MWRLARSIEGNKQGRDGAEVAVVVDQQMALWWWHRIYRQGQMAEGV